MRHVKEQYLINETPSASKSRQDNLDRRVGYHPQKLKTSYKDSVKYREGKLKRTDKSEKI